MGERELRQFGLWESPVTPSSMAGAIRLSDVQWDTDGSRLVWLEEESGTGSLVTYDGESAPRRLTDMLSVRARVGYGGGDFSVRDGVVYFAERTTGTLYRQSLAGGIAAAITPPFGVAASPVASPDSNWLVYVHSFEEIDRLAIVDTSGAQWPQILVDGSDFYMQPNWSPDGRQLAWVEWDHPNMPWIGCRLVVGEVTYAEATPRIATRRVVAGGPDTAILQPSFSKDGSSLQFISDEEGFGGLTVLDLATGESTRFALPDVDMGTPAWVQGIRTHTEHPDGRHVFVAATREGITTCYVADKLTATIESSSFFSDYTEIAQPIAHPRDGRVAAIVSSSDQPSRIVVASESHSAIVRRSTSENISRSEFAKAEPFSWTSTDGATVFGMFYRPVSARFTSQARSPLVVLVHGGPTGMHGAGFSAQVQFLATRGYAVLASNYRGSTGYGREYMKALEGQWGVFDVDDSVSGAVALARDGVVDGERMAILGGSAGGFTVLQTMIRNPEVFAAGVCLYGVSNQFTLVADTHKFEARYSDWLLGALPDAAAVYRERSPELHASAIRRPIAIFHGEDDVAVPRSQSDAIVRALERSHTPHLYRVFPGEGHGWRRRETVDEYYRLLDGFLKQYLVYT
jgi:dipeptidyl aminopeptidase/acylaminoacyl peptidase